MNFVLKIVANADKGEGAKTPEILRKLYAWPFRPVVDFSQPTQVLDRNLFVS